MTSDELKERYLLIRKQIIGHLLLVSSAEAQLAYQQSAPLARVSNELFNAWEDWVPGDAAIAKFAPPVFSIEEQLAVRRFNSKMDAIALRTPQWMPDVASFIDTPDWQELASAAGEALAVFEVRGLNLDPS